MILKILEHSAFQSIPQPYILVCRLLFICYYTIIIKTEKPCNLVVFFCRKFTFFLNLLVYGLFLGKLAYSIARGLINLSNPSINKVIYVCLYVPDTVFAG